MAWLVAIALLTVAPVAAEPQGGELDALGAEDVGLVAKAIAQIEAQPDRATDPDVLFAAGRACEDKLFDPGRAARIYRRIVAQHPSARVAASAAKKLAELHDLLGERDETAPQAAALAQLIAHADEETATAVYERAAELTEATWPGAPAAGRWLADWLRRGDRPLEAVAHYVRVVERWPGTGEAKRSSRGAVGAAIDAHAWTLADALIARLPADEAVDREIREELHRHVVRGRWRDRGYIGAMWIIALALGAFAIELGLAMRRAPAGERWRVVKPPVEIVFLAPVMAVLIGVAFTANRMIAPAVEIISFGGLVLAWLSGAALEERRRQRRAQRARTVAHVALCVVAVIALVYIALTRDALIDALLETVRFGPDA